MDVYGIKKFSETVRGNSYPGRGIVVGLSQDGKSAAAVYFITGRSENSRNRILVKKSKGLYTEPYDISRLEDPSLIIYAAARTYENRLIITNGDQTDTIAEGLRHGIGFYKSLESRCFEPDAPNFTPRISAEIEFGGSDVPGRGESRTDFRYRMSILKSADAEGTACSRYGYEYEPSAGLGHFIHTYECDGNPLPSFTGEPRRVAIPDNIDEFTREIWNSLDADNRIALYVMYTELATGSVTDRLINKHNL